ncbi:hypothetical protein ACI65C_013426 [Semiaphis heraclei]
MIFTNLYDDSDVNATNGSNSNFTSVTECTSENEIYVNDISVDRDGLLLSTVEYERSKHVNATNDDNDSVITSNDKCALGFDLTKLYPTDRGHFEETIISSDLKRIILQYGPCRPKIDFPYHKDGSGIPRKCSIQYYNKTTKSGLKIPRLWICYSVVLDCVYCVTCWLFADRNHGHFKSNWISG